MEPQRRCAVDTSKETFRTLLRSHATMSIYNMTIGKVAMEADVHIETIRYYQRLGLPI